MFGVGEMHNTLLKNVSSSFKNNNQPSPFKIMEIVLAHRWYAQDKFLHIACIP
jgi:hypothetical protein